MSSLAIDPDDVTEVLLADGWHEVDKDSFDLDAYEYITERTTDEDGNEFGGIVLLESGQSGICATGFHFLDTTGSYVAGPLTSVLAVRHRRR